MGNAVTTSSDVDAGNLLVQRLESLIKENVYLPKDLWILKKKVGGAFSYVVLFGEIHTDDWAVHQRNVYDEIQQLFPSCSDPTKFLYVIEMPPGTCGELTLSHVAARYIFEGKSGLVKVRKRVCEALTRDLSCEASFRFIDMRFTDVPSFVPLGVGEMFLFVFSLSNAMMFAIESAYNLDRLSTVAQKYENVCEGARKMIEQDARQENGEETSDLGVQELISAREAMDPGLLMFLVQTVHVPFFGAVDLSPGWQAKCSTEFQEIVRARNLTRKTVALYFFILWNMPAQTCIEISIDFGNMGKLIEQSFVQSLRALDMHVRELFDVLQSHASSVSEGMKKEFTATRDHVQNLKRLLQDCDESDKVSDLKKAGMDLRDDIEFLTFASVDFFAADVFISERYDVAVGYFGANHLYLIAEALMADGFVTMQRYNATDGVKLRALPPTAPTFIDQHGIHGARRKELLLESIRGSSAENPRNRKPPKRVRHEHRRVGSA